MKEYELVVLFHPSLEVDMSKSLDKVAKIITDYGGKIVAEEDWGRKRLLYTIAKEDFAIYHLYTLNLPAESVKKISDILNITDEVLRYLLTVVDPKAKALMAEDAERKAKREETTEE